MRGTVLISSSLLLAFGCGSKTPLGVADTSVPEDTAPPPRPDCFEALSPGEVRGTIEEIHGRPAYDGEGNLYAPRAIDDAWSLVSYDPCLTLRWSLPLDEFDARSRFARTTVDDDGFVWVKDRFDVARATLEGAPMPARLEAEGNLWTWIAIPPAGPVYASTNGTDMPRYLYRTRVDGGTDRVRLEEVSSFVYDGECLVADGAAVCWNVGYDLGPLRLLYYRDPPRIIDGTLRNVTQPAWDGERLWTLRFGISTYDLVALAGRSGEEVVRAPLARTRRGQVDAIMSPPVVGPGGEILVYFTGTREAPPLGQLQAFSADGTPLWSYVAERTGTRNVFTTSSMIAIGDANVAYLAVGESLHAVVVENGAPRWAIGGLGDVNDPALQISPLGDVAVLDDDGVLHVVATESLAVARTPWPVAGGGPGATYAR